MSSLDEKNGILCKGNLRKTCCALLWGSAKCGREEHGHAYSAGVIIRVGAIFRVTALMGAVKIIVANLFFLHGKFYGVRNQNSIYAIFF